MTLCVTVQYGWLHLHVDRDWCSYLILCMYVSVLQGLLELLLDSFGSLFESTSGRSISKCMGQLNNWLYTKVIFYQYAPILIIVTLTPSLLSTSVPHSWGTGQSSDITWWDQEALPQVTGQQSTSGESVIRLHVHAYIHKYRVYANRTHDLISARKFAFQDFS